MILDKNNPDVWRLTHKSTHTPHPHFPLPFGYAQNFARDLLTVFYLGFSSSLPEEVPRSIRLLVIDYSARFLGEAYLGQIFAWGALGRRLVLLGVDFRRAVNTGVYYKHTGWATKKRRSKMKNLITEKTFIRLP